MADKKDVSNSCQTCCFNAEGQKTEIPKDLEYLQKPSLEDLGLYFDESGIIKRLADHTFFSIVLSKCQEPPCLKWKLALGEALNNYLCNHLETKCGMVKLIVPKDCWKSEPRSFIYHTPDFFENEKLVILIHGGGDVQIGEWSKTSMLYYNLRSGSQIPYLQRAKHLGYAVLLLNTNNNKEALKDGPLVKIRGSETPTKHAMYVFQEIIMQQCKAKHIAMIAHGYGGNIVVHMLNFLQHEFLNRVFSVCLIDSTHRLGYFDNISEEMEEKFRSMSRNWVVSALELDEPVPTLVKREVECVSCGTPKYDSAPWYCFESVFEFITKKYCCLKGLEYPTVKFELTVPEGLEVMLENDTNTQKFTVEKIILYNIVKKDE